MDASVHPVRFVCPVCNTEVFEAVPSPLKQVFTPQVKFLREVHECHVVVVTPAPMSPTGRRTAVLCPKSVGRAVGLEGPVILGKREVERELERLAADARLKRKR